MQNSSNGVEAEVELDDNEKDESSGDENEAGRDEVSSIFRVVT